MIHRTIKKVTDDIDGRFHFNTAIAAIMELFNAVSGAVRDVELTQAARRFGQSRRREHGYFVSAFCAPHR